MKHPGSTADPSAPQPKSSERPLESTLDLLHRARHGDDQAVDALFSRYLPPLRRWASGRLPQWARDMTSTDDLIQDALLQTFRRLPEFEPRGVGALHAYLRQAVHNRIRDELRRKARRPDLTTIKDIEPAAAPSPLEAAIGQQGLELYERALDRLRPEERDAIVARIEMGFSYAELAEALGKPSAEAARKAAQRALVRLAEEMKRGTT